MNALSTKKDLETQNPYKMKESHRKNANRMHCFGVITESDCFCKIVGRPLGNNCSKNPLLSSNIYGIYRYGLPSVIPITVIT